MQLCWSQWRFRSMGRPDTQWWHLIPPPPTQHWGRGVYPMSELSDLDVLLAAKLNQRELLHTWINVTGILRPSFSHSADMPSLTPMAPTRFEPLVHGCLPGSIWTGVRFSNLRCFLISLRAFSSVYGSFSSLGLDKNEELLSYTSKRFRASEFSASCCASLEKHLEVWNLSARLLHPA